MAIVSVKELLESGVHYGHRTSRWNPKMKRYIFGKRNTIHIIDLRETVKGLIRSCNFLGKLASEGKTILFVGTKRQAGRIVEAEAAACGSPYVSERWLGGTLTNHRTVLGQLKRLEELERLESSGEIQTFSKKMIASFAREKRKLMRNISGIRTMSKLPSALVVIDPSNELTAVREARKLGIPVLALVDTDSDPDTVDVPIPGNDDAIRSIQTVCGKLGEAVAEGRRAAETAEAAAQAAAEAAAAADAAAEAAQVAVATKESAIEAEAPAVEDGEKEQTSEQGGA